MIKTNKELVDIDEANEVVDAIITLARLFQVKEAKIFNTLVDTFDSGKLEDYSESADLLLGVAHVILFQ